MADELARELRDDRDLAVAFVFAYSLSLPR